MPSFLAYYLHVKMWDLDCFLPDILMFKESSNLLKESTVWSITWLVWTCLRHVWTLSLPDADPEPFNNLGWVFLW